MEGKEHKIETVQDLFNVVTVDNLAVLVTDLQMWLTHAALLKALDPTTEFGGFTWIDDGKNDYKMNLEDRKGNKVTVSVEQQHAEKV
jgi:hypothetical protein